MTTTDTSTALLAAIAANPDEDTPRLAFADYLDGLDAVRVKCQKCEGKGWWMSQEDKQKKMSGSAVQAVKCPQCRAEKTSIDTTNADWAELIRVQVALTNWPCDCDSSEERVYHDECRCKERGELKQRKSKLLKAHPEWWTTAKCPKCAGIGYGGAGQGGHTSGARCQTCNGTGDLFVTRVLTPNYNSMDEREPDYLHDDLGRALVWDRGFLIVKARQDEVMREVKFKSEKCPKCKGFGRVHNYPIWEYIECPTCHGNKTMIPENSWQPTPWAKAVAQLPMVMGIEVEGWVAERGMDGLNWYVPNPLTRTMTSPTHSTRELAIRMMIYEVMRWARSTK